MKKQEQKDVKTKETVMGKKKKKEKKKGGHVGQQSEGKGGEGSMHSTTSPVQRLTQPASSV